MNKTVICHVQSQTSNVDPAVAVFCPVGAVTVNQTAMMAAMKILTFAVSKLTYYDMTN